ncbi:hypothetical protein F4820DRAFT_572 [Hypoxylon rubiginosum]|uniref:Uncharacterized protein n=1 Tax=Hypoxylon rubiginosum TaxID=110542 RepID=A0ACB9ZIG3_9PEZI|nr:hypothetical protein F4820DRAFT_572 [Hypoxylon rubiginosum]
MTSLPLSNDSGAPDSFIYAPLATLACSSMRIENLVRNRFRDLRTKPGAAYWVSAGRSIYPAPEDTRGASDLKVKATSKQVPRVAPAEQGSNMLFAVPSPDKCWFRARLVSSAWHQLNLKLCRISRFRQPVANIYLPLYAPFLLWTIFYGISYYSDGLLCNDGVRPIADSLASLQGNPQHPVDRSTRFITTTIALISACVSWCMRWALKPCRIWEGWLF